MLTFSRIENDIKLSRKQVCTDQVVGSDDVAASDNIGVLSGTPS